MAFYPIEPASKNSRPFEPVCKSRRNPARMKKRQQQRYPHYQTPCVRAQNAAPVICVSVLRSRPNPGMGGDDAHITRTSTPLASINLTGEMGLGWFVAVRSKNAKKQTKPDDDTNMRDTKRHQNRLILSLTTTKVLRQTRPISIQSP